MFSTPKLFGPNLLVQKFFKTKNLIDRKNVLESKICRTQTFFWVDLFSSYVNAKTKAIQIL